MSTKVIIGALALALSVIARADPLIIGVNDLPIAISDQDYQDLVVSITGASVVSTTGSWQAMHAPQGLGSPYWDGISSDAPNSNIGYWINGTAEVPTTFSPDWSVSRTNWYGNSDGTGVPLLFSGSSITVTVLAAFSGDALINTFGYSYGSGDVVPLFTGGSAGTTVTFTPTQPFEFFIESGANQPIYGSDTSGEQHFAVFQDPAPTPEPNGLILLALGTFLIAFLHLRRTPSARMKRANSFEK